MSALVHALVNKVRAPLGSRPEAVAETASAPLPLLKIPRPRSQQGRRSHPLKARPKPRPRQE
jgi:hypothetical protein